jgi:hypothetical protein
VQIGDQYNQLLENGASLWSAVAWNRFGSRLRFFDNDQRKSTGFSSLEVCGIQDDYQSGSKQPHSKGSADLFREFT